MNLLSKISNEKIKNLVRGASQAQNEPEAFTAIKHLRAQASAEDTYFAYKYFAETPIKTKFELPDAFPDSPLSFAKNEYLDPTDFVRELAFHRVIFEKYEEKLLQAL